MKEQYFIHTDKPCPEKVRPIKTWNPAEECTDGSLYNKPVGGVWTSPADAEYGWLDWGKKNDWYSRDERVWSLQPTDASVYTIDSYDDLRRLMDEYGESYPFALREKVLDFEAVFEQYDAIHLTMDGQRETRHTRPGLYSWDCASVLWDDFHFESVECLGTIEEFM